MDSGFGEHNKDADAYADRVREVQLRQQLREKEARIARLESSLQECIPLLACTEPYIAEACTAQLNETPQQSLACIQADAIDAMTKWMYSQAGTTVEDCPDMIDEYVATLRGKADEPTA